MEKRNNPFTDVSLVGSPQSGYGFLLCGRGRRESLRVSSEALAA
jgi:hypothetical protein